MTGASRCRSLIDRLELQPHPEGGQFCEVFRSTAEVAPSDGRGTRCGLTAIYFMLQAGERSRWHRVSSDEAWHFLEGDPLELHWLDDGGGHVRQLLGPVGPDCQPIAVVPAGCWQAARSTGAYSLAGCSVGPGFEFQDFTMLRDDPEATVSVLQGRPELLELI